MNGSPAIHEAEVPSLPLPQPLNQRTGEAPVRICETCGNEYDKTFEVRTNGVVHVFDCFECAIQALAPECDNCGTRIVGHGLEESGRFYCCVHCARAEGVKGLRDRL